MRIVSAIPFALVLMSAAFYAHLAPRAQAASRSGETAPAVKQESPLACNVTALTPEERKRHFDELGPRLRDLKTGVRELPDGYEFEFPADTATYRLLAEWTAGERLCCPFFDVDLRSSREGGTVRLILTGRKGVKQFIEVDGAEWLKQ